jgi:hypothetical protein
MTLVSLTDSCHLLAIDPKTLHRWMKLSRLSPQSHPLDARCKCLTSAQLQQLATTHRRTLADLEQLHCQPEAAPLSAPTAGRSAPLGADVPPDFSLSDLTTQLNCLQAQVVMLQHQLTLLTEQLQKEQEWRTSQVSAFMDKSLESSSDKSLESSLDKSLESSLDKSLESSSDKSLESSSDKSLEKGSAHVAANAPIIDRRKHPHVLPLVEYGGVEGKYVVISPQQGMLAFEPDSPEWFAWLSTLPSFRFVGMLGHCTVHRGAQGLPSRSWRASRQIRNRSYNHPLGKTESLTIAHLEQVAATLQAHLN